MRGERTIQYINSVGRMDGLYFQVYGVEYGEDALRFGVDWQIFVWVACFDNCIVIISIISIIVRIRKIICIIISCIIISCTNIGGIVWIIVVIVMCF